MSPEEFSWNVKLISDRYAHLQLTEEQATKIHQCHEEINTPSDKFFFSEWEERDYQFHVFREVLNLQQFATYKKGRQEGIKQYEKSLAEVDKQRFNEINYHANLLQYYTLHYLPNLIDDSVLAFISLNKFKNREEISLLREGYTKFLINTKKELITRHFRYCRTFQPNGLKISLLHHQIHCLLPDYYSFRQQLDEATKKIALDLEKQAKQYITKSETIIVKAQEGLMKFSKLNLLKYFGESRNIHFVSRPENESEKNVFLLMSLLLKEN